MRLTAVQNVSAIALLAAVAVLPFTEAHAQSSNASEQGQDMGQGTPAESSPNAGSGNNSGQGNTSPGSTGGAVSTQTAGPEDGHTCGGMGHIENDAPGHQHDKCDPIATGSTGGGAAAASSAVGPAQGARLVAPGTTARGGGAAAVGTTADCSLTANLTPLFGDLTQREANVLATADKAALVPVLCPEIPRDPEAQQAVSANPDLVRALEAQGYGVHQVIAAEVDQSLPTIYVEEASAE